MQKRLRISLVIPAYNEESHLKACLDAAVSQSVPFYEIIVVDNLSTDKTAAIASKYSGIRVVREVKQGIAHARNKGFDSAKGDIIARIDADTILPDDWARHITEFYDDPSRSDTAWTGGGNFVDVPFARLVNATYQYMAFQGNRLLIGHPTLWGSNMAIPRQLWLSIATDSCVDRGIHEDLDLAIHVQNAGGKVRFDSTMPVPARLRRVQGSSAELWNYLQWWPETLRRHGYTSWRLCWGIGVIPLFMASLLLRLGNALRRGTNELLSALDSV